jgi:hypothetical protein
MITYSRDERSAGWIRSCAGGHRGAYRGRGEVSGATVAVIAEDAAGDGGYMDAGNTNQSKTAAEPGPRGTAPHMWSAHRSALRGGLAAYLHTVRTAAHDTVRIVVAQEPNSPGAAAAVRHLVAVAP